MAITQTGTLQQFGGNPLTQSNTGSTSITVPADAEIVLLAATGFSSTANFFSGGTVTLNSVGMTLGGVADGNTGIFQSVMWYTVSPPTGSQTVAWDWAGTNPPDDNNAVLFSYTFWKGINTGGAVRDTDGVQVASATVTSGTLTAQSGDKIVLAAGIFATGDTTFTWSGSGATPTEIGELTQLAIADGAWAHADPTGNQTVSAIMAAGAEGSLTSIVLIPAAGGIVSGDASAAGTSTVTGIAPAVAADTSNLFYRRRR